jgi:hypothetical protein
MSLDTRTERRQARHRRNLVIGGVIALASVLSVSLLVTLLSGGAEEPTSADHLVRPPTAWTATGDDVWSDAASPTSVPTSTAPGPTTTTGTPSATTVSGGTAVTVARTSGAPRPATSTTSGAVATASPTTDLPPGQLKRPKPKSTPPPRR